VAVEKAVVQDGYDDFLAPRRDRPSPGDVRVDSRDRVERHRRRLGRASFNDDLSAGVQKARLIFEKGVIGNNPYLQDRRRRKDKNRFKDGIHVCCSP